MPLRLAILLLAIATAYANPNRVVEAARRDTPPAIDADFSDGLGQNQRTRARRALEQIATWRASPWHAGQVRHQLWRMDQNPDLTPDQL